MNHEERAQVLFREGYNCSQAVVCAFCDLTGLSVEEAARLSSSFGGGMGRLREVCGTVSGALLVLGLVCGYDSPTDQEAKKAHYHRVQEYARRFQEQNGSIICRDLLRGIPVAAGPDPEERNAEFYARRPCLRLAGKAAALLDDLLAEISRQEAEPQTAKEENP